MTRTDDWLEPFKAKFAARLIEEQKAFVHLQSSNDRTAVVERAHRLAGLAGMLGVDAVGEAALELEEAAREGTDYAAQLSALITAIQQARS